MHEDVWDAQRGDGGIHLFVERAAGDVVDHGRAVFLNGPPGDGRAEGVDGDGHIGIIAHEAAEDGLKPRPLVGLADVVGVGSGGVSADIDECATLVEDSLDTPHYGGFVLLSAAGVEGVRRGV